MKGLEQLIKTIGKVKRQINPALEIEGILLTMVDARTNYAKDVTALLIENYGNRVRIFKNSIPMSVRAAETSAEGISIYRHDPKGRVSGAIVYPSVPSDLAAEGQALHPLRWRVCEKQHNLHKLGNFCLSGSNLLVPSA